MTAPDRVALLHVIHDLVLELSDKLTTLMLLEMWDRYHPGEDPPRDWPRR